MKSLRVVLIVCTLLSAHCAKKSAMPAAPAADPIAGVVEDIRGAAAKATAATRQTLLAKGTRADAQLDDAWSGFRKAYPYHIQEIAVSQPANGTRAVVVAEPPPNVTLDDILSAAGPRLVAYEVKKHGIGYDGGVKDVALKVSGDDAAASAIVSRLTVLLFQTSYKAHILPLPPEPRRAALDLDVDVTPAEINDWIYTKHESFIPVLGGNAQSADEVFANDHSAVYFTTNPGLVGWWLPKGSNLDVLGPEARQFTLDSDLIVGAIARPGGILVLGRERAVALDDLPPLRFETIALFAALEGPARDQLEQSYERTAPFAGPLAEGRDWAPIHLSPELVDTEYGSLLNLTDQLLKGWSNAGETRYINFPYPRPRSFPFPAALPRVLKNTHTLTYNWNTTGVGYSVSAGDREIYALYRTGALPTSYIPDGMKRSDPAVLSAENKGYQYFAALQDPNLVRVVQYAALYQIFMTYGVSGAKEMRHPSDVPKETRAALERELRQEMGNASGDARKALIDDIALRVATNVIERAHQPPALAQVLAKSIHDKVAKSLEQAGEGRPRSTVDELTLAALAEMRQMPQRLAGAVAKQSSGWIHTAAVVVSQNEGAIEGAVGGHNLYAAVTQFDIADDVPKGLPEVRPDGRLRMNPADEGKAHEVARIAARDAQNGMSPDDISADVRAAMQRMRDDVGIRPPRVALKLGDSGHGGLPPRPPTNRGRDFADHGGGWGMNFGGGDGSPDGGFIPGAILIERKKDHSIVIVFDHSRTAQAANAEDATDAVVQVLKYGHAGSDGVVRVVMRGFEREEGRSLIASCNNRSKAADQELSALIADPRLDRAAVEEIRSRAYDFENATLTEGKLAMVDGRWQQPLVIEIPRKGTAGTAHTDLTLAFPKETTQPAAITLVGRVQESILRVAREKRARFDAFLFNMRVAREVKQISRSTGVPIDIVKQQFVDARHDLVFVELEPPDYVQHIDERRRPTA